SDRITSPLGCGTGGADGGPLHPEPGRSSASALSNGSTGKSLAGEEDHNRTLRKYKRHGGQEL
ncbi:unnamed protein product, partial [Rangifer tarandus platyrhynchus]